MKKTLVAFAFAFAFALGALAGVGWPPRLDFRKRAALATRSSECQASMSFVHSRSSANALRDEIRLPKDSSVATA